MYLIVYFHRGVKHLKFRLIAVEVESYGVTHAYSSYRNRVWLTTQTQIR